MTPETRVEEDGWVTRYGDGWTFFYPVGATIEVEVVEDDEPSKT